MIENISFMRKKNKMKLFLRRKETLTGRINSWKSSIVAARWVLRGAESLYYWAFPVFYLISIPVFLIS